MGDNPFSPPDYDLSKITGFPIAMLCGKEDLLANPVDYHELREQLESTDSLPFFKEYDMGHLGFLVPNSMTHINDMLDLANCF